MREWLRNLRVSKGMSSKSAADALQLTETYYWRIENGERQKKLELGLAEKISNIFGISVADIMKAEKEL